LVQSCIISDEDANDRAEISLVHGVETVIPEQNVVSKISVIPLIDEFWKNRKEYVVGFEMERLDEKYITTKSNFVK
jgi:hypothetical protein